MGTYAVDERLFPIQQETVFHRDLYRPKTDPGIMAVDLFIPTEQSSTDSVQMRMVAIPYRKLSPGRWVTSIYITEIHRKNYRFSLEKVDVLCYY